MTEPDLPIKDAAARARCSVDSLRRVIDRGELPAFRRLSRIYIRAADLEAWMYQHPVAPAGVRNVRAPDTPAPRRRTRGRPPAGTVAALKRIEREATG